MRKLGIPIVISIWCSLAFMMPGNAIGQKRPKGKPSIYISAVKGECIGDLPFFVINGRAVVTPKKQDNSTPAPAASSEPVLTRLIEDPAVREFIREEFEKNTFFHLVDSLEKADIVYHVCSSYWEILGAKILIDGTSIPKSHRIAARAVVVPAPIFQRNPDNFNLLFQSALWEEDTLAPLTPKDQKKKQNNKKSGDEAGYTSGVPASAIDQDGPRIRFTGYTYSEASVLDLTRQFLKTASTMKPLLKAQIRSPFSQRGDEGPNIPKLITRRGDEPGSDGEIDDGSTFKIKSALVMVPTSIMDSDGKFIPGLLERDFQVFEEGVKQEISDFKSTEAPFHVVLMLDVSGSTRADLEDIQAAAIAFIDQLRPQDRMMIVAFDTQVKVESEFTGDREQLVQAIKNTRTGGATRIYDAIDLVITDRLSKIQGRKAMILFTDGVDTASRLDDWNDVITRVEESGVLAYPVHYDTSYELEKFLQANVQPSTKSISKAQASKSVLPPGIGRTKRDYELASRRLMVMAARSGGRYYEVESISESGPAFTSIAEELRRQYWIGYYSTNPSSDGTYRKIKVKVNMPNIVIRAREGYRAPGIDPKDKSNQPPPRPVLNNRPPK